MGNGDLLAGGICRRGARHKCVTRRTLERGTTILSLSFTVFSDVYDWHKKGVSTLGLVKLDVGDIVDLPINRNTLPYLQKTTSTALYVSFDIPRPVPVIHARLVQIDMHSRFPRQYKRCQAKQFKVPLLHFAKQGTRRPRCREPYRVVRPWYASGLRQYHSKQDERRRRRSNADGESRLLGARHSLSVRSPTRVEVSSQVCFGRSVSVQLVFCVGASFTYEPLLF